MSFDLFYICHEYEECFESGKILKNALKVARCKKKMLSLLQNVIHFILYLVLCAQLVEDDYLFNYLFIFACV